LHSNKVAIDFWNSIDVACRQIIESSPPIWELLPQFVEVNETPFADTACPGGFGPQSGDGFQN
jgi:hypothetical protein